jgi:hypothetical protein
MRLHRPPGSRAIMRGMSTALVPARQGIPLRPDRDAAARDWVRSFNRYATAAVLGEMRKTAADAILRETWPDDSRAGLMLRSPVEVLKQSAIPGNAVIQLMRLAPRSSVAQFAELVTKVDLSGVAAFSVPLPTNFAVARFIAEGAEIPAVMGSFSGMAVGPVRKLALISVSPTNWKPQALVSPASPSAARWKSQSATVVPK